MFVLRPPNRPLAWGWVSSSHTHADTHTHTHVAAKSKPGLSQDSVFRTRKTLVYALGPFTAQPAKEGNQLIPGSLATAASSTDEVSISHPTDGARGTAAYFTKWTFLFPVSHFTNHCSSSARWHWAAGGWFGSCWLKQKCDYSKQIWTHSAWAGKNIQIYHLLFKRKHLFLEIILRGLVEVHLWQGMFNIRCCLFENCLALVRSEHPDDKDTPT